MVEYLIKTYGCECGYLQDCEPTPENMLLHHGYEANVCPSCLNNALLLLSTPKIRHSHMERDDIAVLKDTLVSELTGDDAVKGSKRRSQIAKQLVKMRNDVLTPERLSELRSKYEHKV